MDCDGPSRLASVCLDGHLWGIKYGECWMQLQKNTESIFVRYPTLLVKPATLASMKVLFCKLAELFYNRFGVQHKLLAELVKQAPDPDVSVADWFQQHAPLGVQRQILTHGVFPPSDGLEQPRADHAVVEAAALNRRQHKE